MIGISKGLLDNPKQDIGPHTPDQELFEDIYFEEILRCREHVIKDRSHMKATPFTFSFN